MTQVRMLTYTKTTTIQLICELRAGDARQQTESRGGITSNTRWGSGLL